ncbi:tetratricopeptide repeat protein [Streptomyces sp. NPDC002838]|uniref:tetratricopeptide repeat protein n=1 Tax=Streptomyces sp. NPDC002838 TaxID=3154436 RepID=UPI00332C4580
MSRLSRDKKRDHQRAAAPAMAPIDVLVPVAGPGVGGASVGGVPVVAAPGEELQQTVLNHLHHIALATGHAVHATIHDERIGWVVPLRINPDGSSHFTADPVRMAPPGEAGEAAGRASGMPDVQAPTPASSAPEEPYWPAPPDSPDAASVEPPDAHAQAQAPARDRPTHLLRPVSEPVRDAVPTFPLRAVSESGPGGDSVPSTFVLRSLPEPSQGQAPGTVAAPTGEFGPPPVMDAKPEPAAVVEELDPDPKPTPPRGFDAVAEAVLGDEPPVDGTALLAEPMTRINEAVRAGRTDTAAELAEQTVTEASVTLGPEHPEVLRLRELTAYIAYLAGDPVRAFHLSLDLARARRRARDAEAAYGNIQSAATAWRAVRDPAHGLELGHALIGLWTELTGEDGPAADDIEELESARARMDRLTERARTSG